jgi:hypothetical protein
MVSRNQQRTPNRFETGSLDDFHATPEILQARTQTLNIKLLASKVSGVVKTDNGSCVLIMNKLETAVSVQTRTLH